MNSSNQDGIFRAKEGFVYQIPGLPLMNEGISPLAGSIYTEELLATQEGVVAKNGFVFANGKHPKRNIFAFYRKDIGDIIFDIDNWDNSSVTLIERQEWMDKTEEDAQADIESRASDQSTEIEELIIETILGIPRAS